MNTAYETPTVNRAPLPQRILNVLADGKPRTIAQIQTAANAESHSACVDAMLNLADTGRICAGDEVNGNYTYTKAEG